MVGPDEELLGELSGWFDLGVGVVGEYTGPRSLDDVIVVVRKAMASPGSTTALESLDGALEGVGAGVPTWVVLEGARWMRWMEQGAERLAAMAAAKEERAAERRRQAPAARRPEARARDTTTTEGDATTDGSSSGTTCRRCSTSMPSRAAALTVASASSNANCVSPSRKNAACALAVVAKWH